MTIKDVKGRLKAIEELKGDDEAAHGQEDALWQDVLLAIAKGETYDSKGLAREALKSKKLDFARWGA